MRAYLKAIDVPAIWVMFFLTSVYGHVALKVAVARESQGSYRQALRAMATNFWGSSAVLAWGLSCLLWTLVLSRHRLLTANSISSLRYVLVSLAAWAFLGEHATWTQTLGIALIAAGIMLVK